MSGVSPTGADPAPPPLRSADRVLASVGMILVAGFVGPLVAALLILAGVLLLNGGPPLPMLELMMSLLIVAYALGLVVGLLVGVLLAVLFNLRGRVRLHHTLLAGALAGGLITLLVRQVSGGEWPVIDGLGAVLLVLATAVGLGVVPALFCHPLLVLIQRWAAGRGRPEPAAGSAP